MAVRKRLRRSKRGINPKGKNPGEYLAKLTIGRIGVNLLIENDDYIDRIEDLTKKQEWLSFREKYIASIKEICEVVELFKAKEV